jgi:foldase protein PrsA
MFLSGCTSDPAVESASPFGSAPEDPHKNSDVIASIGGISITREQLTDRVLAEYGQQALRSMMLAEAVDQEAGALRLQVTDDELEQELRSMRQGYEDEKQFYAAMKEQLGMSAQQVRQDAEYRLLLEKVAIHNVNVTDEEIDRYLHEHQDEYKPRKQYRLAQILVTEEQEAESVLSQLDGGADFGALARRYSADEFTADNGGDLGWVEDPDPFEDPQVLQTASSMKVGQVTGPIKTGEGYVILQLNGKTEVTAKSPEAIRAEARRQLALERAGSLRELEQSLLTKYEAKIVEPSLRP